MKIEKHSEWTLIFFVVAFSIIAFASPETDDDFRLIMALFTLPALLLGSVYFGLRDDAVIAPTFAVLAGVVAVFISLEASLFLAIPAIFLSIHTAYEESDHPTWVVIATYLGANTLAAIGSYMVASQSAFAGVIVVSLALVLVRAEHHWDWWKKLFRHPFLVLTHNIKDL